MTQPDKPVSHTPGPWRFLERCGIITSDTAQIGKIGDWSNKELLRFSAERWKADASLIAAAPELLEALKLLLDAYGEAHALYDLGDCEGSIKARAAIEKAEGR